jgi:hypothetical protein
LYIFQEIHSNRITPTTINQTNMPRTLLSSATLLALIHFCHAQSIVLTIPFYGYDTQPIDASVVSVDSTATILHLECAPGTDSNDCGLFPSQTLTIGPSTYHMDTSGDDYTGTQDCMSTSICAESAGGAGANYPGESTTTYESADIGYMPVTVTAGATLLERATIYGGSGEASITDDPENLTFLSGGQSQVTGASTTTGSMSQKTGASTTSGAVSPTGSAGAQATETGAAVANVAVLGGVLAAAMAALGYL